MVYLYNLVNFEEGVKMIGYGIGYIGMGTSYNFMSAYFVMYMTNCVGLTGSLAGTITSIALIIEVFMGMIVGNLSDNCTSKMGRRRPFMLVGALGVPPIIMLIFNAIDASLPVKIIYYLTLAIVFRLFFSCYEITGNALGAEIASGYDNRTRLRTLARFFGIAGNAFGYILPLLILEFYKENDVAAWRTIGFLMGGITLIFWTGSVIFTRNRSLILDKSQVVRRKNMLGGILRNYFDLLKLKAMRTLIVYKAGFACAFALYNVGTLYYLQYSLGLSNTYSSYMYAFQITVFLLTTPVINKMALAMGKARQQMVFMLLGGVAGVVIFLTMPTKLVGGLIYIGLFSIVQNGFWQVSSSIFYDVVEVDEYVNYKRREGDIMSLISVLGTIITAIMVQLFGIGLDLAGFDAELTVQPDSVVALLNTMYILVPAICFLAAAAALKIFPINRQTFASLQAALKLRSEGKDFSMYMDDIRKVVG